MMRFIVRILANSLAIYLAAFLLAGVNATGDWKFFLIAGIVLSLINALLKPIVKFISLPLIILTLGLFSIVINIVVVWLLTRFIPEINISGLWAYFGTSVFVSLANIIVNFLFKKPKNTN